MNPSFLIQLKPRSNRNVQVDNAPPSPPLSPTTKTKKKSDPFGAAKPREQVLRQRGVDVKTLDAKYEAKAKQFSQFTAAEQEEMEAVRQELTRLEALWREANEKELPEEVYRVQAEAKREELKELMKKFSHHSISPRGGNKKGLSAVATTNAGSLSSSLNSRNDSPTTSTINPRRPHYLPAKNEASNKDPFAAMSRHRFGTAAN